MSRTDPLRIADYLRHILEAIDNIQNDLPSLKAQVLVLS
jgi:hypothetical protein